MPPNKWNGCYSVNVKLFDEQHSLLIDIIDRLECALNAGEEYGVHEEVLLSLRDYILEHFSAEERVMRAHEFSGYEEHKKEHDQMVILLHEIQELMAPGIDPSCWKVIGFFKDWLLWHIEGADSKYGPFFNSRGTY
jgi:hemerythrin